MLWQVTTPEGNFDVEAERAFVEGDGAAYFYDINGVTVAAFKEWTRFTAGDTVTESRAPNTEQQVE